MTAFDFFCYGHGVFFTALQTLLMFGIFLEWLRDRRALKAPAGRKTGGGVPEARVSLVIPIHNEGRRMGGLLESLLLQDFPAEIIFVDDRSTDESPAMLEKFVKDAAERGMNDCRIITLAENPGPNFKQHALSAGIAEARGDYFLFTDGDCDVPPGWIRAMARRISGDRICGGRINGEPGGEAVGAVIGPVFKKKRGKGFFSLYQCYDHAVRYNYLAGAIGLGAAGGGFGNNLIVSRAALDAAGGYDAVPPSPTEDAALISQIRSQKRFRVRAIALPDAAVETAAEKTWRGFVSQTLRWNNGGLFSPEFLTRFNYNLLMLVISTGVLAVLFLPLYPGLWPMPAGVLIVMAENTIASFGLFRKKLPRGGFLNLGYLLALLFTPVYFTLMTVMGYCRIRVKWKDKEVMR